MNRTRPMSQPIRTAQPRPLTCDSRSGSWAVRELSANFLNTVTSWRGEQGEVSVCDSSAVDEDLAGLVGEENGDLALLEVRAGDVRGRGE